MARDIAAQLSPDDRRECSGAIEAVVSARSTAQTRFRGVGLRANSRPPASKRVNDRFARIPAGAGCALSRESPKLNAVHYRTDRPLIKPAADPAQRARESLVHVLLNHNDFVTVR